MKTRRFVSNELLASIDVLNTITGGASEPQMAFSQYPDHREIRVKVPGIKEENLRAEIHNNILSVLYTFQVLSDNVWIEVPKIIYKKPIPYFVDTERISASHENSVLTVTLPYNSMTQGYHRTVSEKS